jgi:hypothetical protein
LILKIFFLNIGIKAFDFRNWNMGSCIKNQP